MQLDELTQQNAALVEEAAAAAESLEEQALNLAKAVAVFRIVEDDAVSPVASLHRPEARVAAGSTGRWGVASGTG